MFRCTATPLALPPPQALCVRESVVSCCDNRYTLPVRDLHTPELVRGLQLTGLSLQPGMGEMCRRDPHPPHPTSSHPPTPQKKQAEGRQGCVKIYHSIPLLAVRFPSRIKLLNGGAKSIFRLGQARKLGGRAKHRVLTWLFTSAHKL